MEYLAQALHSMGGNVIDHLPHIVASQVHPDMHTWHSYLDILHSSHKRLTKC